jgi:hypothetical protein
LKQHKFSEVFYVLKSNLTVLLTVDQVKYSMEVLAVNVDPRCFIHLCEVVKCHVALLRTIILSKEIIDWCKVTFHLLVELRDPVSKQHSLVRLFLLELLGTCDDSMLEVTVRDHVIFTFVLKLGNKLVDLILSQACFEFLEAACDLWSSEFTTL